MNNELSKKYGLFTAISMVIGIVIGSGVFFKAEKVLTATGGDMKTAVVAWLLGGLIMIICSYTFATMAAKYEKVNGLVDYAETIVGPKYAYFMGWFSVMIYTPCITSVLAWVSARYTLVLFGSNDITGATCMLLAAFYMVACYMMNALSPVLAGKFQVSTTVIKMIPLLMMAVIGTIAGISNGITMENFSTIPTVEAIQAVQPNYIPVESPLLTALVATAFAYEGWIIATSINAEIKEAKRNLPIALVAGSIIVVATYILYYIGLAGAADNLTMLAGGEAGAKVAFSNVFGNIGGSLLMVFVVISCLGTENGLVLGVSRGMYSLAVRGEGPKPAVFAEVDKHTGMPSNSAVLGLFISMVWLMYFYGANLVPESWFGFFSFDSSELPIVTLYVMYLPIFINLIRKEKDFSFFNRYVTPILSIICSIFMVYAAFASHGVRAVSGYMVVYAVIMAVGFFFMKNKKFSNQFIIKKALR